MTKMTDRLSDSNIIELAKRSYENKEKSKLPSSIVNLASKGLVYPKSHPFRKGYTEMRYMTAYDEDILTNTSYIRENIVIDKLLESLILDVFPFELTELKNKFDLKKLDYSENIENGNIGFPWEKLDLLNELILF